MVGQFSKRRGSMDVAMVEDPARDHEGIYPLRPSRQTQLLLILLPDPPLPLIWREAADRGAVTWIPT